MPFQFKMGGMNKGQENSIEANNQENPNKVLLKPELAAGSPDIQDTLRDKVCPDLVVEDDVFQARIPTARLSESNATITSTAATLTAQTTGPTVDRYGSGNDSITLLALTILSSVVIIVSLVGLWLRYRRKQRQQQRRWRNDSKVILTRVEDVMLQLEERDEQIDLLQQKLKIQEESSRKELQALEQRSALAMQAKEEECREQRENIDFLREQNKECEGRVEQLATELKRYVEQQQDHECQLLEQKLQASQLASLLADREAALEEMSTTNASQQERIQELQQKIKSDSLKAEKIIGDLTSERDERFAILQQENDAIKTTIMGMLRSTQEKYDADKVLLKREMRKRDDKIASLQQELWKSNSLLKRLQAENNDAMSRSVHNLILEIKDAEVSNKNPSRRSSTYEAAETILEGDDACPELKELEKLLLPSSK